MQHSYLLLGTTGVTKALHFYGSQSYYFDTE